MDKAKHVKWNNDQRIEYYMAASKSGFTDEATIFTKQNNFILLLSKDIEARIKVEKSYAFLLLPNCFSQIFNTCLLLIAIVIILLLPTVSAITVHGNVYK